MGLVRVWLVRFGMLLVRALLVGLQDAYRLSATSNSTVAIASTVSGNGERIRSVA